MHKPLQHSAPEAPKRAYPDKLFYKIGEVSKIADVEPYVLRYWETEFPFLKPRKSKSGQRIYIKKDLELILEIRNLLYNERFTIEGVRKRLTEGGIARELSASQQQPLPVMQAAPPQSAAAHHVRKQASQSARKGIEHVKERLKAILKQLD